MVGASSTSNTKSKAQLRTGWWKGSQSWSTTPRSAVVRSSSSVARREGTRRASPCRDRASWAVRLPRLGFIGPEPEAGSRGRSRCMAWGPSGAGTSDSLGGGSGAPVNGRPDSASCPEASGAPGGEPGCAVGSGETGRDIPSDGASAGRPSSRGRLRFSASKTARRWSGRRAVVTPSRTALGGEPMVRPWRAHRAASQTASASCCQWGAVSVSGNAKSDDTSEVGSVSPGPDARSLGKPVIQRPFARSRSSSSTSLRPSPSAWKPPAVVNWTAFSN